VDLKGSKVYNSELDRNFSVSRLLIVDCQEVPVPMKSLLNSRFEISTRNIVTAGMIASLYCILVLIFAPISYGPVQIRVAEALTLLPYLWIEAVPGLFTGCILANLLGGFGIIDVIFGSLATLTAAILTRKMPNPFMAAVPPVVVNMIIVGGYLSWFLDLPFFMTSIYIGAGEAIACFGLGVPLVIYLQKKYREG